MTFLRALRQLWRHPAFRRLAVLRVLTQGGDATLQLGMASYVLFSPQRQPDALSIAMMFSVTLLPFSVVAPFVSVLLDRVPRRGLVVAVDTTRALVCALVAVLVVTRPADPLTLGLFFALLLVAMSLNRFLLAGLSAALPRTVDADEMLAANSVMPMVGPLAAGLAGLGLVARLGLVSWAGWPAHRADGVVFALAGLFFVGSVVTALGFRRRALGPDEGQPRVSARDVLAGVGDALGHLSARPQAGRSLALLGFQRVGHGLAQVATILVFRNRLEAGNEVAALADIGLWAALTVVGFFLATMVTPAIVARAGLRWTVVGIVVVTAALQLFPGAWFSKWPLVVSGLLLGMCAQVLKIAVDTVVQSHVADAMKGRVFTLYDMVFNLANVIAAWIAVVLVPPTGDALWVFGLVAASYVAAAAIFAARTRHLPGMEAGTASLR